MVNNNYPQITSVTSEALQAQIRNLLPSQEGFGTDLMAQNVIVPIIDLTSAAEGSSVPEYLQTALAFGSNTGFAVSGATSTIISNAGFYRVIGTTSIKPNAGANRETLFQMTDGLTAITIWELEIADNSNASPIAVPYDFVVFVNTGISVTASASSSAIMAGSTRQVADINGTLVNPSGFSPQ